MNEDKIEKNVMEKIEKQGVKIKPKYIYSVVYGVLISLVIFFMTGAIISSNIAIYTIRTHKPFNYLAFGDFGLAEFFNRFPYLPIIIFFTLTIIGLYIIRQFDISYKRTFLFFVIGAFISIIIIALSIDSLGFDEKIESALPKPLQGIFGNQKHEELKTGYLDISTEGEVFLVTKYEIFILRLEKSWKSQIQFMDNDCVIVIGSIKDKFIDVTAIAKCK